MTFVDSAAGAALDSQVTDATTYYVGLTKGTAGLSAGTPTDEAVEAGYARQAATFQDDAGDPRAKENVATITIPFTATVSGLTHVIVCASAVGGTADVIWFGSLSETRAFGANGGSIEYAAGDLKIRIPA